MKITVILGGIAGSVLGCYITLGFVEWHRVFAIAYVPLALIYLFDNK